MDHLADTSTEQNLLAPPSWFHPPAASEQTASWLNQVEAQGLGPLAYRWLSRAGAATASPAVMKYLTCVHTESVASWLRRRQALLTLLDVLAEPPGIPVVVLKGMALAITLYSDPALRPMRDIDVLAPADRFDEAVARLLDRGYRFDAQDLAPGFVSRFSHHAVFVESKNRPPVQIELHRTLPFLPLQAEAVMTWFWQRQEQHVIEGCPVVVFDPTAQLLHLAVHLAYQHAGTHSLLIWQHDIDQLWRRFESVIVWEEVATMAKTASWEAGLWLALTTTVSHFGTPLPTPVLAWLSQPQAQLSGYQNVQRLGVDSTRSLSVIETMRYLPWSKRSAYLQGYVIPSTAYMRNRYRLPYRWLLPLAYLFRWLDLAADLVLTLIRSLTRRV